MTLSESKLSTPRFGLSIQIIIFILFRADILAVFGVFYYFDPRKSNLPNSLSLTVKTLVIRQSNNSDTYSWVSSTTRV